MQFIRILIVLLLFAIDGICAKQGLNIGKDNIVGTWSLQFMTRSLIERDYKNDSFFSKNSVSCYECPEYVFNGDNSGYVRTADKKLIRFNWYLLGNSLLVKNFPKGSENYYFLKNGKYRIYFNKKTTGLSITSCKKSSFSYFLHRE